MESFFKQNPLHVVGDSFFKTNLIEALTEVFKDKTSYFDIAYNEPRHLSVIFFSATDVPLGAVDLIISHAAVAAGDVAREARWLLVYRDAASRTVVSAHGSIFATEWYDQSIDVLQEHLEKL